jgi:hypothetical protein
MMTIDDDGCVITPFFRTPYNYDTAKASDESALLCLDGTRTQVQFQEETDINVIVERFGLGGEIPLNSQMPLTEDFLDIMDYRSALDRLREADEAFMEFPAAIRARFQNDAAAFCDFVSDPANLDQAREWGLARVAPKAQEGPSEPLGSTIATAPIPTPPQPTKTA